MRILQPLRRSFGRLAVSLPVLGVLLVLIINSASALARGYATDDTDLKPGMVAALSDDGTADNPKAERASLDIDSPILGVVVALGSDLVTVVSSSDQVYVQSTGEAGAFVSDLNGDVREGDLLMLSPLLGVLMKASDNIGGPVVGVALEDFNDDTAQTREIESDGGTQEARIATVRISLDSSAFGNNRIFAGNDSSLRRLGSAITGKEVAEIRVLAALIIFIIVLVAEGGILYGAISSSITALGRNPLAKQIISKEIVKVVVIASMVLILGVLSVYAILWI